MAGSRNHTHSIIISFLELLRKIKKGLKMRFQQVYRNADLSRSAARLFFHFPILWLTGTYSLTNSKVFRFIPSKDREGASKEKTG